MLYTIYNDIHKYGPNEMKVDYEFGEYVIYNGDIVDIAEGYYGDLPSANEFLYNLIEKAKGNFTSGNHEKMMEYSYVIKNNILFTHGDLIFKDISDAKKFRWGKEGSSHFRRFYVSIAYYFRRFIKSNQLILDHEMDEAVVWANKYNCHTVVCGHKHPNEILTRIKNEVKLIVLPRGVHTVDL